ncbi:MAG TPA: isoprenylcysteine carboxylmethyltransferase family protein [Anaerolineales bacterium]|nr:isoprenylcysteine carboxylmethyltransferase family protein [Anaerolineales bacterium]
MSPSLIVFLLGALGLAVVWRRHLAAPSTHGFYRYFAFVGILALACRQALAWFQDPVSFRQLTSWLLLASSLALALTAGATLRRLGRPAGAIEPTKALVTEGIYRHIRHPLYASLILLAAGAWLKQVDWISTALMVGTFLAVLATARTEERELEAQFGDAYLSYRRQTGGFLPFGTARPTPSPNGPSDAGPASSPLRDARRDPRQGHEG